MIHPSYNAGMSHSPVIQVGLPSGGFIDQVKLGLAAYRDGFADWIFMPAGANHMPNRNDVLDGGIAFIGNKDLLSAWQAVNAPVVNLSHSLAATPFPSVLVDDQRVGELAGEHFVERDFEHFAYFGPENLAHSIDRERGFRSIVEPQARSYSVFKAADPKRFHDKLYGPRLLKWLKALPKPCAVFCNDDPSGSNLINFSIDEGFEVPAQMAVLGVNNDGILCAFSRRPMSSVIINGWDIGYQAGALLHALLQGEEPAQRHTIISPTGVALRLSTDITSQQNPVVARALQFIRNSLSSSISAQDVAEHVGTSRRVLEGHFKQHLGHGPYEEITRQRISRGKQLMRDTDWPIHRIATACGFREHSLFSINFRKREGISPIDWRHREAKKLT
jgi:LacI family transcriptional regulator